MKFYIAAGLVFLAIAAVPVWWFCLRAIPLRISQETTTLPNRSRPTASGWTTSEHWKISATRRK